MGVGREWDMALVIEPPPDNSRENNSAFAYRVLRDNIIRMRLKPGETLNEAALSGELGVSRTPVREALLRLKDDNLVEVFPHKASIVSRINFILVHEGMFARAAIEPVVTGMVCGHLNETTKKLLLANLAQQAELLEKADDEGGLHQFFSLDQRFHEILYQACGLHDMWDSVNMITTHYDRVRYFDVISGAIRLNRAYVGHKKLYGALLKGDAKTAWELSSSQMSDMENIRLYISEEYQHYYLNLDF